ncbi:MAG: PEGA domain-containing protein, partial [Vicinamibacterales bacterium]
AVVRATGAVLSAAVNNAGRGFHALAAGSVALAGTASTAALTVVRTGGGAVVAFTRGIAAGLGALGRMGSRAAVVTVRSAGAASVHAGRTVGRAAAAAASGASAAAGLLGQVAVLTGKGMGRVVGRTVSAASAAGELLGRGAALTGSGIRRTAGGTASAAAACGALTGRGFVLAATGIGRAAVTIPRKLYFIASDVADRVPKPLFRPWYLAAALVVIVAVAGVPYARAWLFTEMPAGSRSPAPEAEVPVERPTLARAAGADLKGMGSISVTTDPAGAEVRIDGVLHGRAPLTVENVAEGTHTILVRDGSGSVRQTVRVREDETFDATIPLGPGWLAVFAPVKLEILENGHSIGSTERGRILTPPGPHTIEVVSEAMGFRETRQVEIKPGRVAALTIAMPPATLEIAAPADAEILVDGEHVGTAPLGPIQVAVGTREIVMRHPALGERRQTVSVTYLSPARVVFE